MDRDSTPLSHSSRRSPPQESRNHVRGVGGGGGEEGGDVTTSHSPDIPVSRRVPSPGRGSNGGRAGRGKEVEGRGNGTERDVGRFQVETGSWTFGLGDSFS